MTSTTMSTNWPHYSLAQKSACACLIKTVTAVYSWSCRCAQPPSTEEKLVTKNAWPHDLWPFMTSNHSFELLDGSVLRVCVCVCCVMSPPPRIIHSQHSQRKSGFGYACAHQQFQRAWPTTHCTDAAYRCSLKMQPTDAAYRRSLQMQPTDATYRCSPKM